jgi:hypothetical protein
LIAPDWLLHDAIMMAAQVSANAIVSAITNKIVAIKGILPYGCEFKGYDTTGPTS